ncbi:MAG: methyltransferase [Bacteroidota bacterium]
MLSSKTRTTWRNRLKRIVFPILEKWYQGYSQKERTYKFKGLRVTVPPTVFHPGVFLSTKIFANFLDKLELHGAKLLELGCGSGLLSLYASKRGAEVTATDINPIAINGLIHSSIQNGLNIAALESDLFADIPVQIFDYILINPPYYPKTPTSYKERAFYCGVDFEYFHALFLQMPAYIKEDSEVYMILSEDCDIEKILHIAKDNKFEFKEVHRQSRRWEMNYVFQLSFC